MISRDINNQLLIFLFLNTLDIEFSKSFLKKTLIKNHSKNIKINNQKKILTENLKSLLSYKHSTQLNLTVEEFNRICIKILINEINIDWSIYFNFYQKSSQSERITFILSQVLKLSDDEISALQKVTRGTVRTRVANCYDKLNEVLVSV